MPAGRGTPAILESRAGSVNRLRIADCGLRWAVVEKDLVVPARGCVERIMIKHFLKNAASGGDEAEELVIPEVSEARAREMYALAYAVRNLEPWKSVLDREGFGIRHPDTGEVMTVSLLGQARTVYAVQLYLPDEGIRFWNRFFETAEVDPHLTIYELRMIECEFCNEDDLPDEDAEFNEAYPPEGKRHRRHGYPRFRSMRPRHYPWFIDEDEARLICMALRLVPGFDSHFREHRRDYDAVGFDGNMPEIPVFTLRSGGNETDPNDWEIYRETFPLAPPKEDCEAPADELFLARMEKFKVKPSAVWETGANFLPPTVADGSLVYPNLILTMTEKRELSPPILGEPGDNDLTLVRHSIESMAESAGHLPARILVVTDWAQRALEDLANMKGIEVSRVSELPHLTELFDGFQAVLDPGGPGGRLEEIAEAMKEEVFNDGDEEDAGEKTYSYRPPKSAERYVMRVDLEGAKPPIWRRIALPVDASFFDLHVAIQAAMGWEDYHLHAFELREGREPVVRIELESDDFDGFGFGLGPPTACELTTRLQDAVHSGHDTFYYCYDFGDDWNHKIKIEKTIHSDVEPTRPILIKGRGACPPEDCGGILGYYALLDGDIDSGFDESELEALRKAEFDPDAVKFPDSEAVLTEYLSRLF